MCIFMIEIWWSLQISNMLTQHRILRQVKIEISNFIRISKAQSAELKQTIMFFARDTS